MTSIVEDRVLIDRRGRGRWHGCSVARPDQHGAVFVGREALALDEFILEVFERRVIEAELPLQQAIGHPASPLQHGHRLIHDLFKGHRCSSPSPVPPCTASAL